MIFSFELPEENTISKLQLNTFLPLKYEDKLYSIAKVIDVNLNKVSVDINEDIMKVLKNDIYKSVSIGGSFDEC
jgi:hypothetical protein